MFTNKIETEDLILLGKVTLKNGAVVEVGNTYPEGVLNLPLGSICINTIGASGQKIWIKSVDNGILGWLPLASIVSGTTSKRPITDIIGFEYFDTTLKRPIWWSGTDWVMSSPDATATVKGLVNRSVAVTDVTTADATDLATALTLINALKAKLNAKLAADRTSGQQA